MSSNLEGRIHRSSRRGRYDHVAGAQRWPDTSNTAHGYGNHQNTLSRYVGPCQTAGSGG